MQCAKHALDQAVDVCGACLRPSCRACLIEVPSEKYSPFCVPCSLIKAKVRPGKLAKPGRKDLKAAREAIRHAHQHGPAPVQYLPVLDLGAAEAERFFDGPAFDVTRQL
jgi:hypothetical protein